MVALASRALCPGHVLQVFTAAMDWLLHDAGARRRHVFEVLAPVRLSIVSTSVLERYIDDIRDLSLKVALRKLSQDFTPPRSKHAHASLDLKLQRVKPHMMKPRKVGVQNAARRL